MNNQRRYNDNNEPQISLMNARNILMNTIDPQISLFNIRRINNEVSQFEIDVVYLHIQIIFGDSANLNAYLDNYCNMHGIYTTQMFVNYPLMDTELQRNITSLDCAATWSVDPQMIRVLYRWGADVSISNVDGNYITDGELMPYRNYLSRYVLRENVDTYNYPPLRASRMQHEFVNSLEEIEYIAGERIPPNNWVMPNRIQDHIINRNRNYRNRNYHNIQY